MASVTGQCLSAQSAISRSSASATPLAVTAMLIENGPLGIASSTARIPRSSDSEPTVTDKPGRVLPSVAARIAMSVAMQLAAAARMYQPGGGARALPPTEVGMSVCIEAPV